MRTYVVLLYLSQLLDPSIKNKERLPRDVSNVCLSRYRSIPWLPSLLTRVCLYDIHFCQRRSNIMRMLLIAMLLD